MIDKEDVYKKLAQDFVPYTRLYGIPVHENGEAMVDVAPYGLKVGLDFSKLPKSTGDKLILRKTVCELLLLAQKILDEKKPGYRLVLTYAYRSMEIQRKSFETMKRELGFDGRTDEEAYERTHHFIAVPEVAGHPTGGAVDLLIEDEKRQVLDFGTGMHALENDSYMFSPFISEEARDNRTLLRETMMEVGFAPYFGEWWHYSYGELEWAALYNKPCAFYSQLDYDPRWEAESF